MNAIPFLLILFHSTLTSDACDQSLLIAYGLQGFEFAAAQTHQFCPGILENCCTLSDETNTLAIWKRNYMGNIETHYEYFITAQKFLLGYSHEFKLLADEISKNGESSCKNFAEDFKALFSKEELNRQILQMSAVSLSKVAELRRGFFCIICDGHTHKILNHRWEGDAYDKSRMFFSREFCSVLVENTISSSYYSIVYVQRYLENVASLISCKRKAKDRLIFEMDHWTKQTVKNCFYFRHKYFFFFCQKYCEKFDITRPSSIFEGDIAQLNRFVTQIITFRDSVLINPRNNYLLDNPDFQDSFLRDQSTFASKEHVFFKELVDTISLEKLKTEVEVEEGLTLWDSVRDNSYPLYFNWEGVVGIGAMVFALAWVY